MSYTEKQLIEEARRLRQRRLMGLDPWNQFGFAEYSGGLETDHLSTLYNTMGTLLKKYAIKPYCPNVAKYLIGIYTDGRIYQYGYDGVSKIRLMAKDRSISCCMGVTEARWRGKSSEEMKVVLADLWLDCFEGFAKRIEKAKFEFDREQYFTDTSRAVNEFLVTDDVPTPTPGDRTLRKALQDLVDNCRLRAALGESPPRIGEEILQYLATPEA